jgi:hypothetical protein
MHARNSNLHVLGAIGDPELYDLVHYAVLQGILGAEVYLPRTPSIQELTGKLGTLSQDCFDALVLQQGGAHQKDSTRGKSRAAAVPRITPGMLALGLGLPGQQ